jgi:hypothetical protein
MSISYQEGYGWVLEMDPNVEIYNPSKKNSKLTEISQQNLIFTPD